MKEKHAFVISAYKETKYLEKCVESLLNQTVKSRVIICTSTPNDYIQDVAEKYSIELHIRDGESDIQDDWNFSCAQIDSEWVTVAHQDDIYDRRYLEEMLKAIEKYPDGIMAFTDYRPIIHGEISMDMNCRIQHILRSPMKVPFLANNRIFKKYCLSLGNCIRCPSVCYHKEIIDGPIFTSPIKFSLDWDTFVKFAGYKNRFVYIDKPLAYYRIHSDATTMSYINNDTRKNDDLYMFRQFWPEWIVRIIMKIYLFSYDTYLN